MIAVIQKQTWKDPKNPTENSSLYQESIKAENLLENATPGGYYTDIWVFTRNDLILSFVCYNSVSTISKFMYTEISVELKLVHGT